MLRDQKVVVAFDSSGDVAAVADVEGGREFERVGRQAFDAECAPDAGWAGV